ncbi:MAG: hypothetical protein J6W13_14305 [Salinivirgaceae bacterium]|nr:hypothetical protein [Salinivirgaceae bacterium]
MKHSNLLLIASLFALAACESKTVSDKAFYLTEENMPPVQTIEAELVELPDVEVCFHTDLDNYYVYHDSILIIEQTNRAFTCNLYVMNLNNNEIIGKYLYKGNGRGEVIACHFRLHQNYLLAHDVYKNNLFLFNLDSVVVYGQAYKPKMMQPDIKVDYFDFLTDTSLVICNTFYLDGEGIPENATLPELLVTDSKGKTGYKVPDGIYTAINYSHTHLATNIKKDRVFLGYYYKPQFTILNTKLDTVKIVLGPDKYEKIKYHVVPEFNEVSKKSQGKDYVQSTLSTDEYVFALMDTIQPQDSPHPKNPNDIIKWIAEEHKKIVELHLDIYKFDWDGNLIARYRQKTGNRIVYIAGYSEPTNTLYVMLDSESGEWKLAKIKL